MNKEYLTPEIDVVSIDFILDVLGPSTFVPEETIQEQVESFEDLE